MGCGAIGRVVAKGVEQETFPAFLAGLTSRTKSRAELLARELKTHPPVLGLEKLLAESEVAVVQGSAFGLDGYFRISYATSMDNLKKALERIKFFCENLT